MRRPKVFVVQSNTKFDSSKAEQFGDRVFLLGEGTFVSPFNTDELVADLIAGLQSHDYNPQHDFIVLTGPSISMGLLLAICAARHPVIQTLMFDAKTASYKARLVAIPAATAATEGS